MTRQPDPLVAHSASIVTHSASVVAHSEATKQSLDQVMVRVDALSPADVRAWLFARLQNCARLADQKEGRDRDGWLEDAAYFSAAIGLIDWESVS